MNKCDPFYREGLTMECGGRLVGVRVDGVVGVAGLDILLKKVRHE